MWPGAVDNAVFGPRDVVSRLLASSGEDLAGIEQALEQLLPQYLSGRVGCGEEIASTVGHLAQAIENALSRILRAILHHPDYQRLEGTWRGLHYLVMNTETSSQLKIKVWNCTQRELCKDFDTAVVFDQSQLFTEVCEAAYALPGGEPYSVIIGDYFFGRHSDDVALLTGVSHVAASACCPFVTAASADLLDLETWEDLPRTRDLANIFNTLKYVEWTSFRDSEDSRFIVLTLPRVLARPPYGKATKPIDEFPFEEVPLGSRGEPIRVANDACCWMNAAYVYGTVLADCYVRTGWCTAIRGKEGGGAARGLPASRFTTDDGDEDMKCPIEIAISDPREFELSQLGFLPLVHFKGTNHAVFFSAQTAQKPKKYEGRYGIEATENAAISARLPWVMATSRIAQYLRVMVHDSIGSFMDRTDCEKWLNNWIMNYVMLDPTQSQEMKAKYPLADARIDVEEVPGDPDHYLVVAYLRPWPPLEPLTTSLRTVIRIPRKR